MMQSEAIADDRHLFREFLTFFCKGVEEKGKEQRIKKDHGVVDKSSSK